MELRFTILLISIFLIYFTWDTSAKKTNKEGYVGCDKTIRTTRLVRSPRLTSANRGKAVTCTFQLLSPGVDDLVFELNFKTFHVGLAHNSTWCSNAHMQIVDDDRRVNSAGYFCGKLQHRKTFLAETNQMTIIFHSDAYTRQTHFRFHTSVLPKRLALERHKELILDNPGVNINGSYCDRIFLNCRDSCDVVSPRFPGFYPRNVTCLYNIIFNETKDSRVVIGGHFYDNFDVWAGPWSTSRCSSNYCSSNQISTTCSYDYIRIFDVSSTGQRVLIQTFCGRGHLPRLVSRRNAIQIEFVSAVAGSIANEGFHLSIGHETRQQSEDQSDMTLNSCQKVYNASYVTRGQFQNLRHWYPPGTRCSYIFVGQPKRHKVFLQFVNFNAHREESCRSKLTLYDSIGPDGNVIRGIYCGKHQPNESHLSTAETFYVEFDSKLGSYDGANFEYLVFFTFIDTASSGDVIPGSLCDELFDSASGTKTGNFNFFTNRLRLRKRHISCTFKFQGRSTERVKITFTDIRLNPRRHCSTQEKMLCSQDNRSLSFDSISIVDPHQPEIECLCGTVYLPHVVTSTVSNLEIKVHLHDIPTMAYRELDTYSISGQYEFLQVGCGESQLMGAQGQLNFPNLAQDQLPSRIQCKWIIEVASTMQVLIKIHTLQLFGNCSTNYLKIYPFRSNSELKPQSAHILCGDNFKKEIIFFKHENREANKVALELNSTPLARLQLLWSEITTPGINTKNEDCYYVCKGGRYCLPYHLVCNGVINCPNSNSTWDPLDEGIDACTSMSVIAQWVLLTFCSTFAVTLIIAGSLIFWKKCLCCQIKTARNPQIL